MSNFKIMSKYLLILAILFQSCKIKEIKQINTNERKSIEKIQRLYNCEIIAGPRIIWDLEKNMILKLQ